MMRAYQAAGVLMLLAAVPGLCDQNGDSRPPRPRPSPRTALKADGLKKGSGGAPRIGNPANPFERLIGMSPEQRELVLEKFPPARQALIRERLERFDRLPPAEKARRLRLLETFSSLPPEKQAVLQHQLQAFNRLPDARRAVLGKELQRLRRMPEGERRVLLESDDFKGRFSPQELQMLSDISENYPLPGR